MAALQLGHPVPLVIPMVAHDPAPHRRRIAVEGPGPGLLGRCEPFARLGRDPVTPATSRSGTSGSAILGEFEEDDARRVADGGVMAGELEAAGPAIHPEDGDV